MSRILLLLVALLALPAVLPAQEHVFSPGGRLRVEAPRVFEGRVQGWVRHFDHEGLRFEDEASGRTYLVAPAEIRYVAKFRGNDRGYMAKRRAAMLAFVVGGVGAVAGPAVAAGLGSESLAAGALAGGLGGAVTGAAIGWRWGSRHEGEVWREYRFVGQARAPAAPR